MNGQEARQQLIRSIMRLGVAQVAETGAFRGDTTRWFAAFGVPVWAVEAQPRDYWVSRYRLLPFRNVHLQYGDSVVAVNRWIAGGAFSTGLTLFYLDAHWQEALPLAEEILLITKGVSEHVIVVDDFEVPGDAGYRYDDYGRGKRLCLDYLKPFAGLDIEAFFPSTPSAKETGRQRGCCVLTANAVVAARLRNLSDLRIHGRLA